MEWGCPTVHVQGSGVEQSHPSSHGEGVSSEPGLLLASDLTRLHFLLLGCSKPRRLLPCSEALLLTDVLSGPALSSHCLELSLPVLSIFKDPSWKLSMASVQSN